MITLSDFANPEKINKMTKSSSNGHPDCLVKTNVVGSNHFKEVIIGINPFYLTFLIKTNTSLTD